MLIFSDESYSIFVSLMRFVRSPPTFPSFFPLFLASSSISLPLFGVLLSVLYAHHMLMLLKMASNCFCFVIISVRRSKNISVAEIPAYLWRHTSLVKVERDKPRTYSSKVFLGHAYPQESLLIFCGHLHSSQPCLTQRVNCHSHCWITGCYLLWPVGQVKSTKHLC